MLLVPNFLTLSISRSSHEEEKAFKFDDERENEFNDKGPGKGINLIH